MPQIKIYALKFPSHDCWEEKKYNEKRNACRLVQLTGILNISSIRDSGDFPFFGRTNTKICLRSEHEYNNFSIKTYNRRKNEKTKPNSNNKSDECITWPLISSVKITQYSSEYVDNLLCDSGRSSLSGSRIGGDFVEMNKHFVDNWLPCPWSQILQWWKWFCLYTILVSASIAPWYSFWLISLQWEKKQRKINE